MNKLEAALTYASWGWHVLPVVPNGKVPATKHGVHDATTDKHRISAWWAENPEYNIGIAAGDKSGIVVFDIDPRNGGDSSWEKFQLEHGFAPDTIQALTAGGGEHFLAKSSPDLRSCKLGDGIDFLANGRYFLASPSEIEGRRYEWEASSDPFDGVAPMEIPEKWSVAFQRQSKQIVSDGNLIEGSRNDGLTSLAGFMRSGGMTEAEILAAISVANETRCPIPLPASEIQQIARSVSRYDADQDVASAAAIGGEAINNILSNLQQPEEYYLTRGTSFLSQPSPLPWLVKGWIPAYSTMMIYGESGIGKTFVGLDIACHIATGRQWNKRKTKKGIAVYMAGEGNFGLRQRVAAWAKMYGETDLGNLLISNKAIDLDAPNAAAQVIKAVRSLTDQEIEFLAIDTLNNHMSGDENSARDTRVMINACNIISSAIGGTVSFVHHVAHASEAKGRARGSSAWRGALDTSILVAREETDLIRVSCTKMKDAQEPEDLFGKLEKVDLGWFDEDGEPITGAAFCFTDHVPQPKENKKSSFEYTRKMFDNAWWASGAELNNNRPYITKSALFDYLIQNKVFSKESTAKQNMKPSYAGGFINVLFVAGYIKEYENGFIVADAVAASELKISKKEGGMVGMV